MGPLYRMAVACGFTVMLAGTAQAEVWKEAKNQDGIKVSLSDVPGSDYKAYQGIALINASVSKLRALQEDVAGPAPGFTSASCRKCSSTKATRPGPTASSTLPGR